MNLGLGTSAGIGERKSEVSGHRDVTYKPAQGIQRKENKWLPRKCLRRIPLNVRAISAKNIYQKTTYSTVTF